MDTGPLSDPARLVRGLAEAMSGRVWFEPTIGGGATFVVAFPRAAQIYGIAQGA